MPPRSPCPSHPEVPRVLILGAGFAGLCMAIRLRQAGYTEFEILERAPDLGGTWRQNTYPGAACDIPSHLYSFSFAPDPDWSETHPRQPEILASMERLAAAYRLAPRIHLGTEARQATWDPGRSCWRVTSADGRDFEAEVLVVATGMLSRPAPPDLPGLESFSGPVLHSARWDHGVDLAGRRVGVVGTGASAVQLVPALAGHARHLTVFQRTPSWVLPNHHRPYGDGERRAFRSLPGWRWLYRTWLYWRQEWLAPGFLRYPWLLAPIEWKARRHLETAIRDPELRRALTPDYRAGCKRILFSDGFYQVLVRPDVELIPEAVAEVAPEGVVTAGGRRVPLDALVLCTGFRGTDLLSPLEVRGRQGRDLGELWSTRPSAYMGMAVAGFPNMFWLFGPNTGLGHNSILFMLECQSLYVLECLRQLERRGRRSMEVRPEAQAAFQAELEARMPGTVWALGGCRSWYQDARGWIPTLWPGSTVEYWRRTLRPDLEAYRFA